MEKEKCFIYCRQSSGQDDAENSISIKQQIQNCHDKAHKLNLDVVDVFTDANVSGKTYPKGQLFEDIARSDRSFNQWFKQQKSSKKFREGLGKLFVRLTEVRYIIVDEITRLHRSLAKSFLEQTITYEITNANVKIIQVKGDTIDLSKFDQNLIQMLRTQINDEQITNQKKKSMESRKRIKNEGVLCNIKFFAGVYDGNKKFHFDPKQSEVVLYVYRSILAGKAYSQINYEINIKFPNSLGKAKLFYESTLRHIATQPIYAGYMYNSDSDLIKCKNAPKPFITLKEFLRVQKIMEHKRNRGKHTRTDNNRKRFLPLTGFLKCGICHSNLVVSLDNGRIYYKCKQVDLKKEIACKKTKVFVSDEKTELNYGLMNTLKPLLILSFLARHKKNLWYLEGIENVEKLKKKESRIRAKIQTAFDLFCQEVLDEQTYTEITKERMKELKKLQRQMKDLELNYDFNYVRSNACLIQEVSSFMNNYNQLTPTVIEELMRDCINKITSYEEYVMIDTVFGEIKMSRYQRDNKQRKVFPLGRLTAKLKEEGTYMDKDTIYEIEYDYRCQSQKKNKCDKYKRMKLCKIENVIIYRIDE